MTAWWAYASGLALCALAAMGAQAAPSFSSETLYPALPPNVSTVESKPMMMLVASKDHTLFSPIYTDYEDLDGDGEIDTTFNPTFKYYGYFDATKCYLYTTANAKNRFVPTGMATLSTTSPSVSNSTKPGRYVCGGANQWSGNFLNWAAMTRLDVLRKILYGGQRSTDSTTETELHIARLSQDSHSFVKYYRGEDIRDYTPFSKEVLTKASGQNAGKYAGLSMCIRANVDDSGESSIATMRMVKGNYRLWATVNGSVCQWGNAFNSKLARYYGGTQAYQGNGGINHESDAISQATDGATYNSLGPDLNLKVKVCDASMLGDERCTAYGSGSSIVYKPVGLLQNFGTPLQGLSAARTEFGLITGSYDYNLTAGALRKNIGDLLDEIKPSTGQFCFSKDASCSGTLADGRSYTAQGSIRALDQIQLFGRGGGQYGGSNVQQPWEMSNGTLAAWGNPMGEMVVQALRYYAGLPSTNPPSTVKDASVFIPVATWSDPLSDANATRVAKYGKPICRPLNVLALSSSALSFDGDDADTLFDNFPNRSNKNLTQFTNTVGNTEGITDTKRSVGSADRTVTAYGETCSAKTVAELGKVSGICPEAPAIGGTYKVAGAALYANTNRLRNPSTLPSDLPASALKAKTYAASLSGGVARIDVPIPKTTPQKYVYITPEGLWAANYNNKKMPAAMLTFSAVSSSEKHGAFIVTWNDSLFGGDYDMDVAGYLRYDILDENSSTPKIKITTDILNIGAGWTGAHGFSIIGTVGKDGRYITHRHGNSDSVMAGADGYLCGRSAYINATNLSAISITASGSFPGISTGDMTGNGNWACNTSSDSFGLQNRDSPVAITFTMDKNGSAQTLREPLWYAAKYGAFSTQSKSASSSELPTTASQWDVKRNDGRPCVNGTTVPCEDGEPDAYFLARRPELLEKRLQETLESIVANSNSAPAVSSVKIKSSTLQYAASFNPSTKTGSLLAYKLGTDGNFSKISSWDAGEKLKETNASSRQIITNDTLGNSVVGQAFTAATTFSTAYKAALEGSGSSALTSSQREELVNYLRGDTSKEKPAGIWRARSGTNLMGTIVNSSPWIQGSPAARHIAFAQNSSYASFVTTQEKRKRLIWTGANDGMLHGFDAQTGAPVLSYVPSVLANRLKNIAQDDSQVIAGMDGSPYTGDVWINDAWKTYLFSSVGRGAKAFFALDVTNPSSLSEGNAGNIFKWMFSASDDADMGYYIGEPQIHSNSNQANPIVRLNNGKYAVLLPNGVGSANGKAKLFILYVDGPSSTSTWTAGTHYIKLDADDLGNNGLMGVNWVDLNNNGTADLLYATDVQGRLWKFDISSANPTDWKSAFNTTTSPATPLPFFEAKSGTTRLPISTNPTLAYPRGGGVMVTFGTGKAIESGDFPDASKTQRMYGIYDRLNWSARALPNSDMSTLVARNFVRQSNGDVYVKSNNQTFDKASQDGWYANFAPLVSTSTNNNEMVISSPQMEAGILFFTGVRPTQASTDATKCFSTPQATAYAIDPFTGTPTASVYGTTTVGNTNMNIAGRPVSDQKNNVLTQNKGTDTILKTCGSTGCIDSKNFAANVRRQWREIPNMRTNQ